MSTFKKLTDIDLWYKAPVDYSHYVKGHLEERDSEFVFIYDGGEILNPSLDCIFAPNINKKEIYEERLHKFCVGLQLQEIDKLMEKEPEVFLELGQEMARQMILIKSC